MKINFLPAVRTQNIRDNLVMKWAAHHFNSNSILTFSQLIQNREETRHDQWRIK